LPKRNINWQKIKLVIDDEGFPDIAALAKQFPQLSARILGYIGKCARDILFEQHLKGQDLKLENYYLENNRPFSKGGITRKGGRQTRAGVPLTRYQITKDAKAVNVSSIPLNLFEGSSKGGRMLRSGEREDPKRILRGTLRSNIEGRMAGLLAAAQKLIIDDWFNDRHKGGMRDL
jgi:hypothetical protein